VGCFAAFLLALTCAAGWASERDLSINRFHHTEWTQKDGAPADVWAIAQTTDGWLWFGGTNGLFRFDGVRFEPVPTGDPDSGHSVAVSALLALESGELLIGYQQGGASVLRNGQFTHYRSEQEFRRTPVLAFANDGEGALWAATLAGLLRFDGQHWQAVGQDWNFPEGGAVNLFLDQTGVLWVACREGVLRLARGSRKFERSELRTGTTGEFIQSTDGRSWLSEQSGVTRLPGQEGAAARAPFTNQRQSYVSLVDREGNFWSLFGEVDRGSNPFPRVVSGIDSKIGPKTIMEDSEGDVWLSTAAGIHRFRRQDVNRADVPDSAALKRPFGLATAADGTVFMSIRSARMGTFAGDGVWTLHEAMPATPEPPFGLVSALQRAGDGSVWVVGDEALWRHESGKFRKAIDLPADLRHEIARGLDVDTVGGVWVSLAARGLFCHLGTAWLRNCGIAAMPTAEPFAIARDSRGRLWLGYEDGTLRVLADGRVTVFARSTGLQVGAVSAIGVGTHALVAGERGLALFRDGRFLTLQPTDAEAFAGIRGMVELANGDVWLNGAKGAVRIPAAELRRALEQAAPTATVAVEVFGNEDGYPGAGFNGSATWRPIAATPDGRRIWVGGTEGVGWIDPAQKRSAGVVPRPLIRALTAEGRQFEPVRGLQLAKGTRSLQIDYTALSYAHPERVRFRYRLEGVDDAWVEAAARRQAFYTNLGPGTYTFAVTAGNGTAPTDGSTVSFAFVIPPTFMQSRAFVALCVLMFGAALILIYRMRVRQITTRVRGRLEDRLAERERIARELHDTLLQGTEGLMLTVHAAARRIPSEDPTRQMLDLALERASGVMAEGRDRIQDLRSTVDSRAELSASLAAFGAALAKAGGTEFRVVLEGRIRELAPGVDEEMALVGREALSNAFRHASAQSIELQVIYGETDLRLRIRDDGRGLDEKILATGSPPGHWGLQGMQERAHQLGGRLDVWSRPDAGTEIELVVPAPTAYPARAARRRWPSLRFFGAWRA